MTKTINECDVNYMDKEDLCWQCEHFEVELEHNGKEEYETYHCTLMGCECNTSYKGCIYNE